MDLGRYLGVPIIHAYVSCPPIFPLLKGLQGGPSSQFFSEEEDSGMVLNDSQIENMNRIICKKDAFPPDMELSPSPSQIWSFLTRIGVQGTTTAEALVNSIRTMEQRDLKSFLESVQVPEADCTQAGRGLQ
ncbi:hypothetical protein Ancab_004377 [Ancistrocladus abbreviatus]